MICSALPLRFHAGFNAMSGPMPSCSAISRIFSDAKSFCLYHILRRIVVLTFRVCVCDTARKSINTRSMNRSRYIYNTRNPNDTNSLFYK